MSILSSLTQTSQITSTMEGSDPEHPVHIYTEGVFDCFHFGHAKVLEQCKKLFPYVYLVVGICSDEDTTREKGRPIMTNEERAECVRHCKWADEVLTVIPWVTTLEFLDRINCKYIAHDPEPYPFGDIKDLYAPLKEAGRFLSTQRTDGISTSDIIFRILKDYEMYVERSVKKGAKQTDINISKYKYLAVKINLTFKKMKKRKEYNPLKFYFHRWNLRSICEK